MLLSEVLSISKKLNHINESYKSDKLRNIISDINKSSMYTENRCTDIYDLQASFNSIYRQFTYNNLSKTNLVTLFNNINTLSKYIDVRPLSKNTNFSFIKKINQYLHVNFNTPIDISNITDNDITEIDDLTKAKTKQYKQGLQFWVNQDNQLRAVTYYNKIICLIIPYNTKYSAVIPNKSFSGNYTSDEIESMLEKLNNENYKPFNDYIKQAFIMIQRYNILYDDRYIKNELDANALSINKLIEYFNKNYEYINIYCINNDAMINNNINQKIISRKEYNAFLNEMRNYLYKQRERYKDIIKDNKNKRLSKSKETKIIDLLNEQLELLTDIYDLQINLMASNNINIDKLSTRYISVTGDMYKISQMNHTSSIKNMIRQNYSHQRRNRDTYYDMYIYNIYELIILVILYIQSSINRLQSLIDSYASIQNAQDNPDEISMILNNIKQNIQSYNLYTYNSSACRYKLVRLLKEVNINNNIIQQLDNIMSKNI